jgi:hypothetical protein
MEQEMSRNNLWLLRSLLAGLLCVSVAGVPSVGAGESKLPKRHRDPLYGFSLVPPGDTQRRRGASPMRLVSWLRIDKTRQSAIWTLDISQAVEANREFQIEPYSKALAGKLWAEEQFKVESIRLAPVAGKAAIDLSGKTIGRDMWQRQVWILARPQEFIILKMTGPRSMADELTALSDGTLGSMEFFDPKLTREQKLENLSRGAELLAGFSEEKLAAAIRPGDRWYLMKASGKYVGFRRMREKATTRSGSKGYQVQVWIRIDLPGQPRRLMKHTMFITGDRRFEWSRKYIQIGSRPDVQVTRTDMLRQDAGLVCTVIRSGRGQPQKLSVPLKNYLPQAVGMLLPRLVDLDRANSQAFLVYNAEENILDLRTLSVSGPGEAELGGQKIKATKLVDQPTRDAEPTTLWLGEDGNLIWTESEDDLVMERSSFAAVKALFPDTEALMKAMGE